MWNYISLLNYSFHSRIIVFASLCLAKANITMITLNNNCQCNQSYKCRRSWLHRRKNLCCKWSSVTLLDRNNIDRSIDGDYAIQLVINLQYSSLALSLRACLPKYLNWSNTNTLHCGRNTTVVNASYVLLAKLYITFATIWRLVKLLGNIAKRIWISIQEDLETKVFPFSLDLPVSLMKIIIVGN